MFDKSVHESLSDALEKVLHKIDKCRKDINDSAYDAHQDIMDTLNDLKTRRDKLVEDLKTVEDSEPGVFETVRISAEALIRESSEKIDSIVTSKKIKDQDIQDVNDLLSAHNKDLTDYRINTIIFELKSKDDIIRAERTIRISNTVTGKEKDYHAGFSVDDIWQETFTQDLESAYFDTKTHRD